MSDNKQPVSWKAQKRTPWWEFWSAYDHSGFLITFPVEKTAALTSNFWPFQDYLSRRVSVQKKIALPKLQRSVWKLFLKFIIRWLVLFKICLWNNGAEIFLFFFNENFTNSRLFQLKRFSFPIKTNWVFVCTKPVCPVVNGAKYRSWFKSFFSMYLSKSQQKRPFHLLCWKYGKMCGKNEDIWALSRAYTN